MKVIYLVGINQFSRECGDVPNADNFPSYWYESLHDALQRYRALALGDKCSGASIQETYLVEIDENGNKTDIRGRHCF